MDTTWTFLSRFRKSRAFTVLELMVIIGTVLLLAALLLPVLSSARRKGGGICCNCNLKQIGISFRLWEGDNNDRFPMQFYTNATGGLKFADATNGFRYFQTMSNELSTPKVLVCPNDRTRTPAKDFAIVFGNTNLSYFVGLDVNDSRPAMFLAGDRNITNGTPLKNGLLTLTANKPSGWTMEIHRGSGNIGLTDGSVQYYESTTLNHAAVTSGTNVMRLLMP